MEVYDLQGRVAQLETKIALKQLHEEVEPTQTFFSPRTNNFYLFSGIGIVIVCLISLLFIKHKKSSVSHQKPSPLPTQLTSYVRNAKSHGMNESQIKGTLYRQGWRRDDVERAYRTRSQ